MSRLPPFNPLDQGNDDPAIPAEQNSRNSNQEDPSHGPLSNKGMPSSERVNHLLSRLVAGTCWVTTQHRLWVNDKPGAASNNRFSESLALWDNLERELRSLGFVGCIFGPTQRCPKDAPVACDECKTQPTQPSETTSDDSGLPQDDGRDIQGGLDGMPPRGIEH